MSISNVVLPLLLHDQYAVVKRDSLSVLCLREREMVLRSVCRIAVLCSDCAACSVLAASGSRRTIPTARRLAGDRKWIVISVLRSLCLERVLQS